MIATLEFNLPDETEEYQMAYHGSDYKYILDEVDGYLRNKVKHANESASHEKIEAYQEMRDMISTFLEDLRE